MFWLTNTRKRSEKRTRPPQPPTRLRLEWLEDRRLLCDLGPGSLDETFGIGGKVTTPFDAGTAADSGRATAIQPDGKIVAAGYSGSNIAVARYNADGTLDNTFSGDGKATTAFARPARAEAVLIQPEDGKIAAVGTQHVTNGNQNEDFALVRYKADGSLDKSFGSGGKVTTAFSPGSRDWANGAVLQPDGKIVAVGGSWGNKSSADAIRFALARYDANGSLDSSFGNGGKVVTDIPAFLGQDGEDAADVVLQTDGKIVVTGRIGRGTGVGVARYNTNGSLDTTFGTGGIVTTAAYGSNTTDLEMQADGKLVVGGWIETAGGFDRDMLVLRYNTNGTLDTTFDSDGMLVLDLGGEDYTRTMAIQSDGRILVGGLSNASAAVGTDFALVRLNSDGTLDATFGSGGIVLTDFSGQVDRINALALQADGKLVAVGESSSAGTGLDFALARYCT